jgi:hypothetical protein
MGITFDGFSAPFLAGCHSEANSGYLTAKLLSFAATRPEHTGQPLPAALSATLDRHSWPWEHRHQTLLPERDVISQAVNSPFFSECHEATRCGNRAARLLSKDTARPQQKGHPWPFVLSQTGACHSWPSAHFHQAFFPECGSRSYGEHVFLDDHWAAMFGNFAAKLRQAKHFPKPLTLRHTEARHSCPFSHFHQTCLFVAQVTSDGESSPFFKMCHSFAKSGLCDAKLFLLMFFAFVQRGHPRPPVLLQMLSSHSCPHRQIHHARLAERGMTSHGFNVFLSTCHSAAISGYSMARL